MPWPESWPIRGEDVAFADSAATRKDSTSVGGPPEAALPQMWRRPEAASFLVAAESVCNILTRYWPRLGPWHIGYVS